jgi:hypothetical protein
MKFATVVGIGMAVAAVGLALVAPLNARNPKPVPPAPTASEFASPRPAPTIHAGQNVPVQPGQLAMQQEIASLAQKGNASAMAVDVSTGKIIWVTAEDNSTFNMK